MKRATYFLSVGLLTAVSLLLISSCAEEQASHATVPRAETKERRDGRMQWWRECRFGMFVHWGLYSGLAGTWKDKPVGERGGMEWIQQRVRADTWEYAHEAVPLFRPKEGFAREWAKLARQAGCRYLVFTTKHHDGFCLFDSEYTTYDAHDLIGRDLCKEIVDATRNEGLKVGFYHSVIDWHHPQYDYIAADQLPHALKGRPSPNGPRNHDIYVDYLHRQTRELFSNYGPVDIIWWDYSEHDHAWKSPETLIHNLVDIVSKGGNYLLNIGPKGDGSVPAESIESMRIIGQWMAANGEAIYGTTASPFERPSWGRYTKKASKLYVHVFEWPQDGILQVPARELRVTRAYLLADSDRTALKTEKTPNALTIHVPRQAPDDIVSVVVIEHR